MIPAEMVQMVSIGSSVNVKQTIFQFLELGPMIPAEMIQLVSQSKPKSSFFIFCYTEVDAISCDHRSQLKTLT
jgi:hypothetical protein